MNQTPPLKVSTSVLLTLAAGTLGFGVNQLGLPVFGGTEIIFGGVFTLLVTYLLGPTWGTVATAIAFSATWLTWGHPWGLACFTLEALVVGWLHRHRGVQPIRGAAIYWLCLGVPLAALGIFGLTELSFPANFATVCKYPVNSLLAALLAMPMYQSQRFRRLIGLPLERNPATPLQRILFRRLGLIITLSIATLSLFAGGAFDRTLRRNARDSISADGHEVAIEVQSYLDRHLRAVTHIADVFAAAGPGVEVRPDPLSRARAIYPGFLTLLVADESGLIVSAWPARNRRNEVMANNGFRVGDRDYFNQPRTTRRPYISDIFRGRGFGDEIIVAMSAPIHDRDGRFLGVAEGSLNLQRLGDDLNRPGHLAGRTVVVVDRTGRVVLAAGAIDATVLSSFGGSDLSFAARTDDENTFHFDNPFGGHRERYLGTRHIVPDFGWQVYLAEPLWRTQRTIAIFYLTTALVAAAAIGFALWLARGTAADITHPLTELVAATRRLTEADAPAGAAPGLDETGHLSRELADISRELHGTALRLSRTNRELANTVADRDQTHENLRGLLMHLEEKVMERTRELVEARRAAESANDAKSDFLASMSHELRTPLNVIVGMSELINDQTLGPLNPRQAEGLQNIHESGRHLLDLINDILDLSKIEAGQLQLDVQPMEIEGLCQASIRFVREAARRKDIRVELDLPPDLVPVLADERRLKQILVNLLANAVKFTPAGGRVGLRFRLDTVHPLMDFEVWDTGIGIATENFDRIFEPFQQIDSSLSRQYAGTGLGLALVRRMVHLHGGTVEIESETGRGSHFHIRIPWHPEAAPVTPAPAAAGEHHLPLPAEPLRILIAEDNEANRQVYATFFATRNCAVTFAGDGREAVDLAHSGRPDLVLMDIHMPVMDGLEATRLLRADPRTELLPIIAVTALAMAEDRVRCLEAGANAYLTKPLNLRELGRTVARYTPAGRAAPADFTPAI